MKKRGKTVLVGLAAMLLCGCKTEMVSDVYTADIFDVENLKTPAVMNIEISSCNSKKRPDYEQKVLALFDAFSEAKLMGCSRKSGKSMLSVGFNAEITSEESSADFILYRDLLESDVSARYLVKPAFSSRFLKRVDTLLKQNLQKLNSRDIKISMVINNDLKGDVLVSARNVWIDGEPIEHYSEVPLSRRGRVIVTLPDVTSDLIIRDGRPVAFEIMLSKSGG